MKIQSEAFRNALSVFQWMPAGLQMPLVTEARSDGSALLSWKLDGMKQLTVVVGADGGVFSERWVPREDGKLGEWVQLEWEADSPFPSKIVEYLQAG